MLIIFRKLEQNIKLTNSCIITHMLLWATKHSHFVWETQGFVLLHQESYWETVTSYVSVSALFVTGHLHTNNQQGEKKQYFHLNEGNPITKDGKRMRSIDLLADSLL